MSRPRGALIQRSLAEGGSIGDIGTHAYHLAGFVTGLKAEVLSADLARFVEGRLLDDNAHVLIRYEGGGSRAPLVVCRSRSAIRTASAFESLVKKAV